MIFPKKLKRAIGPYDITVNLEGDLGPNMGVWNPTTQHIIIDKTTAKHQVASTFWHEVLEAANQINELNLTHPTIESLSNSIAQVLVAIEEAYGFEIGLKHADSE